LPGRHEPDAAASPREDNPVRPPRALLVAVLALLGSDEDRSSLLDGQDRSYLSTDGWPLRGQGAYVLDNGQLAVSPHQQPIPIASVQR
jgi:hypothetical protein